VDDAREVVVTADGPVLVSGPVEIVLPDGRRVRSDRPVTALCVCRRSRRAPFCDTSHRRKVRTSDDPGNDAPDTPNDEENRAQPHRTVTG
jgi:CDGSH-type Zn-finger protein